MNTTLLVILLVFAYAVGATCKLFVQSKYSKNHVHSFSDTVVFWLYVFLVIGVVFVPMGIVNGEFKKEILIYGILTGIFAVGFQLFYTLSLSCGPVGLSAFFTSASSVTYIVYSIIVFKEPVTVCKIIAFVLFIAALCCNVKKDPSKNVNAKWIILITITCLFLFGQTIVSKYFARAFEGQYKSGYLAIQYLTAFVLTGIIAIPLISIKKTRPTHGPNRWYFILGGLCGLILVGCMFINQYTVSIADMSYFTPIRGALCMIFAIFQGWIIYKEKPTWLQWIGIVSGISAAVLVNF